MMSHQSSISLFFFALLLSAHPAAAQWEYVGAPDGGSVRTMAVVDSVVMIGEGYRSLDQGNHWVTMTAAGDPTSIQYIDKFAVGANNVIIGTCYGVNGDTLMRSTNLGATWNSVSAINLDGHGIASVLDICFLHDTLLMSATNASPVSPVFAAVWMSTDGGVNWHYANSGMDDVGNGFAVVGDDAFVVSATVRKWNREFGEWDSSAAGLVGSMKCICAFRDTLYVAGDSGVFRSVDRGHFWTRVPISGKRFTAIAVRSSHIATVSDSAVFQSMDDGATWTIDSTSPWIRTTNCIALTDTSTLLGSCGYGVSVSSQHNVAWRIANSGIKNIYVIGFAAAGSHQYILVNPTANAPTRTMFRSDDSGKTWVPFDSGLISRPTLWVLYSDDSILYAGNGSDGLYRTNGSAWTKCFLDSGGGAYSLARFENKLFVAAGRLFESDDNGISWQCNSSRKYVWGVAAVHGVLIMDEWGEVRSSDFGKTWVYDTTDGERPRNGSPSFQSGINPQLSAVIGDTLFMSSGNNCERLLMTTDLGVTWSDIPVDFRNTVTGLVPYGPYLFVSSLSGYVSHAYVSLVRPGDTAVHSIAANLPPGSQGLAIMGEELYVGSWQGVYRRPIAEILSSVGVHEAPVNPTSNALNQNFPNPFSGITNIDYTVGNGEHASMKVFDLLGREVAMLDADSRVGEHRVRWDASAMPRGTYVCRITCGNEMRSVRMTVLK